MIVETIRRVVSARADCEQHFLAQGIFELFEVQRRLALIAKHLEHGRPAFFRHFHAAIFEMDDVHLQRLDQEVPVVAAIWTGQRHVTTPSPLHEVFKQDSKTRFYVMAWTDAMRFSAEIGRSSQNGAIFGTFFRANDAGR